MSNIGKYELLEVIGSGGFGTVYHAKDTVLSREVALKELHPQLTVDPDFVSRFKKEAQTLALLDHPNIVNIHELGEDAGRLFIVMQYISGASLRERVKKSGRIAFPEALTILQQIGTALSHAHEKGLVHRDIKPENILFHERGDAMLSDFGLVKSVAASASSKSTGAVLGTPSYVAPEIWEGREAGPACDQYALACVAFEMLSGKTLFNGDSAPQIMKKHFDPLVMTPDFAVNVPAGVNGVLMKALAKDPQNRFRDIKAFIGALVHPEGFKVTALPPSRNQAPPLPDVKKKKKLGWLLPVAIILSVVFIGGIIGIQNLIRKSTQTLMGSFPVQIAEAAASSTPEISTETIETVQSTAEPTQRLPTSTIIVPTATVNKITTREATGDLVGAGVSITSTGSVSTENGKGILEVLIRDGSNSSREGIWIEVFAQKLDVVGNWVTDQKVASGYTDNSGKVEFQLPAGDYIVSCNINGYNWGNATDVNGEVNIPVVAGQGTRLLISTGKLTVGFINADNTVFEGAWVEVYTQKMDIVNNPVSDQKVASGYTTNSGTITFDLSSGFYIVRCDMDGYNWGSATDLEGEVNIAVTPGESLSLIVPRGQLIIALIGTDGNPATGEWIEVYTQKMDVTNNPVTDSKVVSGYTDNSGSIVWNLTSGYYAVKIDDQIKYDIPVEGEKITVWNGSSYYYK